MSSQRDHSASESAWLIERGQSMQQVPTVWWTGREPSDPGDKWVTDAWAARRFPDRESAEAEIASRSRTGYSARGYLFGVAVEHGFMRDHSAGPGEPHQPPTPDEDVDTAIGAAILDTDHIPGMARKGPYIRAELAKYGWAITRVATPREPETPQTEAGRRLLRAWDVGDTDWGNRDDIRAIEREAAAAPGAALDRYEAGLAAMYAKYAVNDPPPWRSVQGLIAEMCDEHMDRSGALLGRVRALAAAYASLGATPDPLAAGEPE